MQVAQYQKCNIISALLQFYAVHQTINKIFMVIKVTDDDDDPKDDSAFCDY